MFLESIPMEKLLLLTRTLRVDGAWRRVATRLGLNPAIHIVDASRLVSVLMSSEKTVEELRDCLKDLELYDALSYISEPERLLIVREPYCGTSDDCYWDQNILFVRQGGTLHLKIDVVGSPMPSHQWLRDNVLEGEEKELIISNFCENNEGLYHCRLRQLVNYGEEYMVISEDVQVRVFDKPPKIIAHYGKCDLEYGDELFLHVTLSSVYSKLEFKWWHGSKLLDGHNSNILRVPNVDENWSGKYELIAKNRCGETSQEFMVRVKTKRPSPSEKRALIITISDYKPDQLHAAHRDGETLRECLLAENFKCTVWQNLLAKEIENKILEFFRTLKKNAFVVFFFAGHGFMDKNSLYFVGCGANIGDNADIDCIVPEQILERVQEYDPLLFVPILDMCQKQLPSSNYETQQSQHRWQGNVIQCYATSQNRSAFEEEGVENSLYVKHLKTLLQQRRGVPFLDIVKEVNECVEAEASEQKPKVTFMGRVDFKLSDPVSYNVSSESQTLSHPLNNEGNGDCN